MSRSWYRFALCYLVSAAGAAGAAAPPRMDAPVAVTNVSLVRAPGQPAEPAALLIRDGRIAQVGADVPLPPGTRVIDAAGGYAYAGFIDAFTRVGVAEPEIDAAEERRIEDEPESISDYPHVAMPMANRHGVFARRAVERLLDIEDDTFDDQRSAGFTAGLVAPPRAILGGTSSVVLLGDGPLRRGILVAEFAHTAAFESPGARALRERGNYPGTLLGVTAQLRQTLLDARWRLAAERYQATHPETDLPHDPDLARLRPLVEKDQPLLFEADTADEIGRALDIAAEFDLRLIIVGGRQAWRVAERLKQADVPVLVSLELPNEAKKFKLDADALSREVTDGSVFGKAWQKRPFYPQAAYDAATQRRMEMLENPRRLSDAGVRWAFATHELEKPGKALERVREFIEAGLAPEDALRGLTSGPAEIVGLAGELGQLGVGRRGNVTLLSAPLGEKDARVTHVIVAGRVYEFFEKDRADRRDRDDKDDEPDADEPQRAEPETPGQPTPPAREQPPVSPERLTEAEKRAAERRQTAAEQTPPDGEPATQPATQPSPPATRPAAEAGTRPATQVARDPLRTHAPDWPIETDAQRVPSLRTGGSVLLQNAYVITMAGDDLPNASVLIENGTISAVGRDVQAPAGVTAIDLRGHVLMPGIFDPHAHEALDGINEWTMSVTPEVRTRDVVRSDDPGIYWALSGGTTAMHTMHGSANSIGGQNVILKNKYGRPASELILDGQPRTVKFATGENVKRPGMRRQRWNRDAALRFPGTRMGVEATMRRALYAGQLYAAQRRAAEAGRGGPPLRRDLRLEALADILAGDIWVNCHCYRSDEILRVLAVAEDFGFRVAALHHVLEGYRIMPEIHRHGCGTATFADWWAYKIEAFDAVPHNAGMMLEYGINSTLKSDSGDLIRHMNLEAAKCMKYSGLTAHQALALITTNAVRLFGLQDRLGTIEVGKDGDVAVFDGHPLDTFSRCVMTIIEGEIYFTHPDFDPQQPPTPRRIKPFAQTPAGVGPGRAPATPAPNAWAIVHGAVHPVSGPPIESGVVIIRDGRIEAVGRDVPVPADAERIDASGMHVYPGLINAATNVGLQEIEAVDVTVDTGEIGVFQPDVRAVSAMNPHSAMIPVTRNEGITTVLVVPNRPTVAGQAGAIDLIGWTLPEALVDPALGLVVSLPSAGPEPIIEDDEPRRPWEQEDEEDEDATARRLREVDEFFENARLYAAAADRQGDDAATADPQAAGRDESQAAVALRRDPRYDAMIPYVRGDRPVLFSANTYKQILEALQFAERHELRPIILGGRDAWKLAELLAQRDVPVIYEGTFAMPSRVPGLGNVTDAWNGNYTALARMANAGVRFCLAHRGADLAKLLPIEAGFAVAHGLDPDRAVRAMTLDAAEILGLADTHGSLDPGKVANVIVTTDHPAQATARVAHLFIRGQRVPLESKHTRAAQRFAERPTPDLPPPPAGLNGPPSLSR